VSKDKAQNNVATRLRFDGIVNYNFVTNLSCDKFAW